MPKKEKAKMEKSEKDCIYICDVCGCEVMCTKPGRGHLICCDEMMCCC